MKAYQALEDRFGKLGRLQSVNMILFWDRGTMMPAAGAAARGEQMGVLAEVAHQMIADPAIGDLIEQADESAADLDRWQAANLREMRRLRAHETALGDELSAKLARATGSAGPKWIAAKTENDFTGFAPTLAEIIALTREAAARKSDGLGLSPYDALLDSHDPGTRRADIDPLFDDLESYLPETIQTLVANTKADGGPLPITDHIPAERQEALSRYVLDMLGYTQTGGRIDPTEHPFCMPNVPGDYRITTRYDTDNWTYALMGTAHECGHAMYEINLPKDYAYQPVGAALGGSTHESQSLAVEMIACRSEEFIRFLTPKIHEIFGVSDAPWSYENLLKTYRLVKPSFIRVEADEVTYPLHIILRYRIERALLDGDLTVDDIPGAWNDEMEKLLGIRPETDSLGCLQDIHWSMGMFGYFPTYSLGALKAAQFFHAATMADNSILPALGKGDFSPWLGWVKDNVHSKGSLLSSDDLMHQSTGMSLGTKAFKNHVQTRYLSS